MTKIRGSRTGTPAVRALVMALAALSLGCADQASIVGPSAQDPSLLTSTTIISSTSTTSSVTSISSTSTTSTTSSTSITTSTSSSGGSGRMLFTVGPYSTVRIRLGDHQIYFPAGSICDPARSSYGPTEWDKPCYPLRSYITISATWWTDPATGHPQIEFQPALRFVPTSDMSKWVTLTLKDQAASSAQTGQSLVITWRDESGNWVDESLTDPTLRTVVDPASSSVSRRIKHFSGYLVSVGRTSAAEPAEMQ
jgi:hypothetical protein